MQSSSSSSICNWLLLLITAAALVTVTNATNFKDDADVDQWGKDRVKVTDSGDELTVTLNKESGSGFQTKKEYLFSRFDVEMKLAPGNTAGVVTTFYLSSLGTKHDEIDLEFLGNVTGDPVTLHTNVFSRGEGRKEKTYHLWFDPSKDFHLYTIEWTPQRIKFMVDNKLIRVHNNHEKELNLPYPTKQPMRAYASIWNGDDWATRGGAVKVDWNAAPFTAHYRNLNIKEIKDGAPKEGELTEKDKKDLASTEKEYMIYNYCDAYDRKEVPECDKKSY